MENIELLIQGLNPTHPYFLIELYYLIGVSIGAWEGVKYGFKLIKKANKYKIKLERNN